ncbi:BQ5605_C008g05198 [Microbotryum silenes-dioicae]|uniref:BQ5605_C008g05198 protein n=1 Tax=Microbotryum silenes-dioicae TaxID=796604 RepID=A0A2X0PEJ7_9BASI|nr:BQ5605_C008g05198 [Microbotryum silenes-dioicae]
MSPAPVKRVWATLLTKTNYLQGCVVLDASLKHHGSQYPLVVFATPSLPQPARDVLRARSIEVHDIEYLEPKDKTELNEHDHRFADTWTKLGVFGLTQYERIVLLDSDMLVTANMDELMTMPLEPDQIAAAHACTCNPRRLAHYPAEWTPENCAHTLARHTDPLPADRFTKPTHQLLNSGLVVLTPTPMNFAKILDTLSIDPIIKTFKFPDQDLLAYVFKGKFVPLSYRYNALKTLRDCHQTMWRDDDVKNVHYILDKPWAKRVQKEDPNEKTHRWWWEFYEKEVLAKWGDAPGRELVEAEVVA